MWMLQGALQVFGAWLKGVSESLIFIGIGLVAEVEEVANNNQVLNISSLG